MNLTQKSFTISFLIHLIIFTVFIFELPLKTESFKPTFYFLGALLKKQDITEFNSYIHSSSPENTRILEQMIISPQSAPHIGAEKPSEGIQFSPNIEKKYQKSIFDTKTNSKETKKENLTNSDLSPEPTPYIPLRFFSHD